jgi:hypothetical protein
MHDKIMEVYLSEHFVNGQMGEAYDGRSLQSESGVTEDGHEHIRIYGRQYTTGK